MIVELREAGGRVSEDTVAEVMRQQGWVAREHRWSLTRPGKRPAVMDLVCRDFSAPAPDRVRAATSR